MGRKETAGSSGAGSGGRGRCEARLVSVQGQLRAANAGDGLT